jgi:hypothetical protein
MWSHSQQAQSHRFHIFTGNISREQSAQIERRPLALLAPVEQRSEVLVVGHHFFGQRGGFFRS